MTLICVLIWTLLCFTQGSDGQNVVVTQQPAARSVQLRQTVTVDCKASRQLSTSDCSHNSQPCISWYHQKSGEAPKALIYGMSHRFSGVSSRFSGSGAGNGLDFTLTISGVEAEDSGVYYSPCSSALGEFIVLRVEDWMTDSCFMTTEDTEILLIKNMTLICVLIWTLLCFTQGSDGQNVVVTQQPAARSVQLRQTVTVDCKVSPTVQHYSGSQYYLSWYLQKSGEAPKALIYRTSDIFSGVSSRFSGSGAGNGLDFTLTISGVEAEDSGVYYCQSYHDINSQDVFTQ
ncbi:LOW QUALITY PROTEIN: uncharacterized protein LOC106512135 [Austrofundulus limnaeus]|uniref:LOW QUALITY PROTEIN: uncharacterized protein LOC106512135 n=1 Tax=Austrofundulus limnaeus TaxID=52670 RepID=A0A2I4AL89_AUSLI|nr:PREDICTED: LOW QUALITY PROTEIN: uncharacterized protein LOC106512135 [Austrofundulus limnaeus]